MKRVTKKKMGQLHLTLSNWTTLNDEINNYSEEEVHEMLDIERTSEKPRDTFMVRLYARYNKLRSNREREEMGLKEDG